MPLSTTWTAWAGHLLLAYTVIGMAIHIAMALAWIETLALSAVLLTWARAVPGARLLVVFLLGVATWIAGNALPNLAGIEAAPVALALLATVPLTAAAFLHFCVVFTGTPAHRLLLPLAYGGAGLATLLSLLVTPGRFEHVESFTGVDWVVIPNAVGWVTSLVWASLAAGGLWVLARAFWRSPDPVRRRQIAAVAASCGWGLFCTSGFAFAALRLPLYPWQVLALPAYPLILVYGILRYEVFVANAWARRGLAWAILLTLGLLVVPLSVLLPFESRALTAALVAAVSVALNGPVRRLAERLVYPGGTPTAGDLLAWRRAFGAAPSLAALAETAASALSQRMGVSVHVRIEPREASDAQVPTLECVRQDGAWSTRLVGFDRAPPGQRHLAELAGTVVAEAAAQVELAAAAEQRERDRQLQARLAELGALAASVAHDLRNPLNVMAMAVAFAPDDTRRDMREQIARISRLADDLLDYAKPWEVQVRDVDLLAHVRAATRHAAHVEIGPGLAQPVVVRADPARLDQVLANLLTNAQAAAGGRRVQIDAESGPSVVRVHVCDDGPGFPAELRERLFQPFASRSPGGTGLGLAIVARIMAAHGGTVELTERPPWRTCFTLSFPRTA